MCLDIYGFLSWNASINVEIVKSVGECFNKGCSGFYEAAYYAEIPLMWLGCWKKVNSFIHSSWFINVLNSIQKATGGWLAYCLRIAVV